MDEDDARKGKACVIKTSTRQTVYLPIPGLVDVAELKPGDLIGTVSGCKCWLRLTTQRPPRNYNPVDQPALHLTP